MDELLVSHVLILVGIRRFGSPGETLMEPLADHGVKHFERDFLSIDGEHLLVAVFIVILLHLVLA